jgi:hypothetical protein
MRGRGFVRLERSIERPVVLGRTAPGLAVRTAACRWEVRERAWFTDAVDAPMALFGVP